MSNQHFFAGTGVHFGGKSNNYRVNPSRLIVESYDGSGNLIWARGFDPNAAGYDAAMTWEYAEQRKGANAWLVLIDADGNRHSPDTCSVMCWRKANCEGSVDCRVIQGF